MQCYASSKAPLLGKLAGISETERVFFTSG